MKCPGCERKLQVLDSRAHYFGTTKRHLGCACGFQANSIEAILPAEFNGQPTSKIAYRMSQAASGAKSEPEKLAGLLRHLADSLDEEK